MARIPERPWWLESIVHFAHYLGVKLYPHQLLWCALLEKSNKSLIYSSRRCGKSYAVALFLTYMALKYPKGGVSIVCPALSQAKRNLETIRNFITSQPKLDPYIDRRFGLKGISQTKIRLTNGSCIEAFGIKSNIDSVNSTVAYIDEYADCDDNIINERVLPSLAAKRKDGLKSKIVYSGVPKFINDNIYSIVNDPSNKGTNILPVIRYTDAIELGALDPSSVDMIKSAITDDEFERAFNCNWTQDTFSYLTNETLHRCQNIDTYSLTQYIKPGEAIIGFDMSGRGESSGLNSKHAAVVFQKFTDNNRNKECFRLSQIRLWDQDYPLEALKQDLKDMWFENKCRFGLYDMFGDTFMNGVQKEIFGKTNDEAKDLPWQGIRYGDFVKHQMFSNAKVLMETGRLLLPVEEPESFDFYQHIRNCQTERSSKNILLYKKKKQREPDDLLQAMVLCLYCDRYFELKSNDYTPVAFAF